MRHAKTWETELDSYLVRLIQQNLITEVEARLIYGSPINAEELLTVRQDLITKIKDGLRYEYYLHYIGVDKRYERWVTQHHVWIDSNKIEELTE